VVNISKVLWDNFGEFVTATLWGTNFSGQTINWIVSPQSTGFFPHYPYGWLPHYPLDRIFQTIMSRLQRFAKLLKSGRLRFGRKL